MKNKFLEKYPQLITIKKGDKVIVTVKKPKGYADKTLYKKGDICTVICCNEETKDCAVLLENYKMVLLFYTEYKLYEQIP
jgi:hypothetical protein